MLREDHPGRKMLVGYVVPRTGAGTLDPIEVRAHAALLLPDHMVPAVVVVVDDLPRSSSGKLDRLALPAPDLTALSTGVAPRTGREAVLARLFAEVLGLPAVGVEDGLFDLGGDSITAIQLVSRARDAGLALTAREVFAERTVAGLAAVARELDAAAPGGAAGARSDGPLVALGPDDEAGLVAAVGDVVEVLPLSPLQEGLYFHAALHAGDPGGGADAYMVQHAVDLAGPLDARDAPGGRRRAARPPPQPAGRVPPVRQRRAGAGRRPAGGGALARGRPRAGWTPTSRRGAPRCCGPTSATAASASTRRRWCGSRCCGSDGGHHRLILTCHHILADGWSARCCSATSWRCSAGGEAAAALPPATPYREHLRWLAGRDREAALAAWRAALAGLDEPTRLSIDAPPARDIAVDARVGAADRSDVEIGPDATASLVALARRRGVTLNTLVQAAWGLVVGMLAGRDDVVFGTTVSGRSPEVPGVESMVGLFINTVPTRVSWRADEPVAAVLDRLQAWQVELLDHHHVGLAGVQRAVGLGELFDSLVVFENTPLDAGALRRGGRRAAPRRRRRRRRHALPALPDRRAPPAGRGSRRRAAAPAARPHRSAAGGPRQPTAARVARTRPRRPGRDAGRPEGPVRALDLVGDDERATVVEAWNATAHPVPDVTLVDRLEAQAARTPDAVALVCGDERLTYAELAARSGAVAGWLAGRGVGPESVVAVRLPRSLDLVVALVAVLRSGAAYLPLDPDLPADRLVFMAADAGAAVVLDETLGDLSRLGDGAGRSGPTAGGGGDPARPAGATRRPVPDNAAYVIYTSGSTGRAEGHGRVAPRHRQPAGVDAGHLPHRPRRPGAPEDAGRLRRVGVGAVLAAVRGRHAGARRSRRPPRPRLPGRAGARRAHHDHALRPVDARRVPAPRRRHRGSLVGDDPAPRDEQRRGAARRRGRPLDRR